MSQEACSLRAYFLLLLKKKKIILYMFCNLENLTMHQMHSQVFLSRYMYMCIYKNIFKIALNYIICNALNHFPILVTLAHDLMINAYKWHCKNQKVCTFSKSKYIHFKTLFFNPNGLTEDCMNLYSHNGIWKVESMGFGDQ